MKGSYKKHEKLIRDYVKFHSHEFDKLMENFTGVDKNGFNYQMDLVGCLEEVYRVPIEAKSGTNYRSFKAVMYQLNRDTEILEDLGYFVPFRLALMGNGVFKYKGLNDLVRVK